jgi:hypothetical protein
MSSTIKFIIDYKQDTKNCFNFFNWRNKDNKDYLKKFLPKHLQFILNKSFTKKEKDKIIREYTKSYYLNYQQYLKDNIKKIKKEWTKVEPKYYKIINKIFKNHPWPKGNYRAFGSIYNMYPRHIDSKIFYFPAETNNPQFALKVIAHEMTHFIYFDYLKKKYKLNEDSKIKGKKDEYVWLVSEIFNYTLERWAPYKKIFKNESKRKPYFGNENLCQKMHKDWQKKQDIDWLLDKWLN